ncbi:histone H1-like [Bos mutus]|uniref:histone H1-like n=1 Tax=Bos mutus TaxID=72004 RepID=UPI0038B6641A
MTPGNKKDKQQSTCAKIPHQVIKEQTFIHPGTASKSSLLKKKSKVLSILSKTQSSNSTEIKASPKTSSTPQNTPAKSHRALSSYTKKNQKQAKAIKITPPKSVAKKKTLKKQNTKLLTQVKKRPTKTTGTRAASKTKKKNLTKSKKAPSTSAKKKLNQPKEVATKRKTSRAEKPSPSPAKKQVNPPKPLKLALKTQLVSKKGPNTSKSSLSKSTRKHSNQAKESISPALKQTPAEKKNLKKSNLPAKKLSKSAKDQKDL